MMTPPQQAKWLSLPTRTATSLSAPSAAVNMSSSRSSGILDDDRRTTPPRTSPQQAEDPRTTRRRTGDDDYRDGAAPPLSLCVVRPSASLSLHKVIRTRQWERVLDHIERDPRTVPQYNRHGWSSLLLAIYHDAPDWIIQSMVSSQSYHSSSSNNSSMLTDLLSRAVPNGNRLCLHFAARYTNDVHTFRLLVEPYPTALLTRSDDGLLPIDRARFYRKDAVIIDYLQRQTTTEQDRVNLQQYNQILRETVVECCGCSESTDSHVQNGQAVAGSSNNNSNNNVDSDNDRGGVGDDNEDDTRHDKNKNNIALVRRLYRHVCGRAMPDLFRRNVLDYVGVHRLPIPHSATIELK